ncbi:MAG: DM13 domain-containing protein, partial [Actinomycetota bacterium]
MSLLQNKAAVIGIGAAAAAVVAFLAFGVFGIQTLFTDTVVDEGGPVFAGGESAAVEESEEFQDALDDATDNTTAADEAVEDTEMAMENEIVTLVEGDFGPLSSRYNVTGEALVLNDGSEQRFLRFENFESTNGPDLNVYLRADNGDFVDLGDLKGNIGDQNYEIPADVDLAEFNTVEIWCVRRVGPGGAGHPAGPDTGAQLPSLTGSGQGGLAEADTE